MNIVYVARYFPPIVSGAGRRLGGLADGLVACGANVFVLAPLAPEGLPGLAVPHRAPHPPHAASETATRQSGVSVRNFVRHWARIPDADAAWAKQAARAFLESPPFQPDWIVTSAPPESVLLAGRMLKRATHARWACDFRDHWLVRPHREDRHFWLRQTVETLWGRRVLRHLDLGFAVNSDIQAEYQRLSAAPIHVLEHFVREIEPAEAFRFEHGQTALVHTGRFGLSDANCDINDLLTPFADAVRKAPSLRLHLAGALTAQEQYKIRACSAHANISVHGVVSPGVARAMQAGATALLLVAAPDATAPPSKIVEYSAARRPIIAIGPDRWRQTLPGQTIGPADLMVAAANGTLQLPDLPLPQTAKSAAARVLDLMASSRNAL